MSVSGNGVVLAGRDSLLSLALKRSGIPPAAEVTQAELLFGTIDRCHPGVLVFTTDLEGIWDLAALVSNLAWLFPDLPVVMVSGPDGRDAGPLPAGWYLFPSPPDYRRLVETVRQILAGGGGNGCRQTPTQSPATPAPPTPSFPPARSGAPHGVVTDRREPSRGPAGVSPVPAGTGGEGAFAAPRPWGWEGFPAPQVVTVCSPKGGVGKTFVAVNLAAALSSRGAEVLLLDWDLPSADASIHLNLQGGPGILELVNSGRDISPEVLREHLVRHTGSGLYVLKGPLRPELAEFVGQDHLRNILASARGSFPVVVIDTAPSPCDEALCQALEGATRILLLVVQDPACLYQARVFLDLVPRLGIHRSTVGLVVNRYREGCPDVRDIQAFLGIAPAALLPDDPGAARAVMEGTPYVLRQTGPLATAFLDLAQRMYPVGDDSMQHGECSRRGWFGRRVSPRLRRS